MARPWDPYSRAENGSLMVSLICVLGSWVFWIPYKVSVVENVQHCYGNVWYMHDILSYIHLSGAGGFTQLLSISAVFLRCLSPRCLPATNSKMSQLCLQDASLLAFSMVNFSYRQTWRMRELNHGLPPSVAFDSPGHTPA